MQTQRVLRRGGVYNLQSHHDPDCDEKIRSAECHSPNLSQLARSLLLQLLVSRKWTMHLGDIKGAPEKYRPLYAHLRPNDVAEIKQLVWSQ